MAELPVYLGRRPSAGSSPPLDDDPRQSFPATVRERDSFASTWTGAQRDSVRGPPPPLPPKPFKQQSWSSVVHPPASSSSTPTLETSSPAKAGPEPQHSDDSPEDQGSPTQWLDIMLGHSEAQPTAVHHHHSSSSSPFPAAPRLPPRPPLQNAEPPQSTPIARTPSPAIQLTPSATPPTVVSPPHLPSRPTDIASARSSPSRPPQTSTSSTTLSSTSSSHHSSTSPSASTSAISSSSALNTIGAGIQHLKLKDRFAAGVGFGREWGGKGKEKLQEGWRAGSAAVGRPSGGSERTTLGTSPTEDSAFAAGHARARSTSPLPASILGHRLPKNPPHLAFGLPLVEVLEATRVQDLGGAVHRKRDDDPVTGDEARRWLPSVAYRSLQYLEEWGKTEEGVYRVPGRSNLVSQLRALFDAGIDPDLREIHPGDLDPHAVASLFKSWLREIPDPLLSPELEQTVEALTSESLGYTASVSQFLGQKPATTGGGGMVDGRAPRAYLEKLRELFANDMAAEYFYLLRALSYHLARLASHAGVNKMTLGNLRLILSPTLRLSPIFLQILVEEREILFGKTNESARRRMAADLAPPQSPSFASVHTSPSLSYYGNTHHDTEPSSSSARQSPLLGPPSPRLDTNPKPSPPPSTQSASDLSHRGSHPDELSADQQAIGATHGSLPSTNRRPSSPTFPQTPSLYTPSTANSPTPSLPSARPIRTPIADRFVSTFSPPMALSTSRSSNGSASSHHPSIDSPPPSAGLSPIGAQFSQTSAPAPPPKPFIPSRQTTSEAASSSGSFFSNRSPVLGSSNGGGSRKGSVTSLGGGGSQSAPSSTAMASRSTSGSSVVSMGTPGASTVAGQGRRGAVDSGEATQARQQLQGLGLSGEGEQEQLTEQVILGSAGARRGSADRMSQSRRSGETGSTTTSLAQRRGARSSSVGNDAARPSLESLTRPSMDSLRSYSSTGSTSATTLPSLELPAGLGLGLGSTTGVDGTSGEDGQGWGLLTMEERKRFFGG